VTTMRAHCQTIAIVAVLALLPPATAAAAAATPAEGLDLPLIVGVDLDYPPLSYERDIDRRREGFDVDVAYALCSVLERRCEIMPTPFTDVIGELREGRLDIAVVSMSITPERAAIVDFSKPYYRAPNRYLGRPELAARLDAGDPVELRIGVRDGTTYERYATSRLAPANTILRYRLQSEIFADLLLGRLDLVLGNGIILDAGFLATPLGDGFALVGEPDEDGDAFGAGEAVALRKGQARLRAEIDTAIETLREDGSLDDIWQRYFPFPPGSAFRP
jgi:arginine/ornithine transport system substrate-binding protein